MSEPKFRVGDVVFVKIRGRITDISNATGDMSVYTVETVQAGVLNVAFEDNLALIRRPDADPAASTT